jgi:hypothetical protein
MVHNSRTGPTGVTLPRVLDRAFLAHRGGRD